MSDSTADLSMSREALIAIIAKFALAATGFLGVVIFSRVLGVNGVGRYYTLLAAANLVAQISSGVNGAIKKRVSEVETPVSEYFGLGVVFNSAFVAVLAVLLVLTYPLLQSYVGPFAFGIGFIGVVASLSYFALVNRVYAGIGNTGASFWTDTLRSLLTLAAQVVLLWLGWHVLGLLIGFVAATAATAVVVYLLLRLRPAIPSRETVSRTYEFARWNVPNGLLQNMYSRLDVLLLYAIVGSSAVGLYEPALRLTIPATFISASIGDSLVVKASGLHSIDRDVVDDLKNAVSYTCLLSIPIFFGVVAMPAELMTVVYGPDFAAGAAALVGLAAFQLFNTLRQPFAMVINGIDRPDLQFRVKFLVLVIHAPLAVGLGLEYGLLGVIAATVATEIVRVCLYLYAARKLFEEIVLTWQLGKQLLSGVVMFVVVAWLVDAVGVTGWVSLIGVVGVGAAVYFAALGIISAHFRSTLGHAFTNAVPEERQFW
ncbi:oligosaccharide flippase family protein [Halobaculum magnesiiphilum]|uniref:Oligosaccharide flippase family protein n=1 Tax=Halobaculum magnesiiphilum TaxID=1017351 RepID=A0A8T8WCF0_9EURY|nr:oligosaccharide flippase family protein [Halobaculum magnesiiphilum]QZP37515.1 oligosaccharide flippase family protein [Halobaculum magnesiiphilum]